MASIKQHESLRVPMGWKDQDKALIGQLERIFDDIYKRFGRLAWEDLGEKLQEKITDIVEGAVTAVTWDGDNSKLTVTINGTVSDVVAIATIKAALNLSFDDIVTALGYTPVKSVDYDSANKKITKTINGTTTDVVAVSSIKSALGSFTWGALAGQ